MTQPLDFKRNAGMALDLGLVNGVKVNRNAADRRAASLANRRTVKKEYQAAWLVRAIECMDLTTLSGDDTPGRVERLCMKAMRPLRAKSGASATSSTPSPSVTTMITTSAPTSGEITRR